MKRLQRQLAFVRELDKAKTVLRQNPLADASRRENDAEHMWHFAVAALLLAEHAASPVNTGRVVLMGLIHDIVEIDAGDAFVYDDQARADKAVRERAAADRLFAMLPPDQGRVLREAWDEFEEGKTAEARFAASIDRLLPLMANHAARGGAWAVHGVKAQRVRERNASIADGAPALAAYAAELIEEAVGRGWLCED